MSYAPYVDAALADEDFQGLMDELAQDHQERFGENQIIDKLSEAESSAEVAAIVDATVDQLTMVAQMSPEDTWMGWFGSFFDSADADVTDYDDPTSSLFSAGAHNAGLERKGDRRRRL